MTYKKIGGNKHGQEKIAFIGLGIMGKPMSKNLLNAGYELTVYDLNAASIEEVVSCGAKAAGSAAEAVKGCGIAITMLPNSPHVKTAVMGENGVLEGACPGMILIDMSSIAPLASQKSAKPVKRQASRCWMHPYPAESQRRLTAPCPLWSRQKRGL